MELDERYHYTAPQGTISPEGVQQIASLIGRQWIGSEEWQVLNAGHSFSYVPALPETWQWVWSVPSGEFRGTMPRRVAQYYHKTYKLNVPKSVLSEIGNIGKRESSSAVRYEFEFVDRFNWIKGEFGDPTSCFWGGRSDARTMLRDHAALAMRFYQPGTNNGIARALIVAVNEFHIVFNGYGFPGDPTRLITRIFADWRGEAVREIKLSNYTLWEATLYINGQGRAFAVGAPEVIAHLYSHDLHWDDDEIAVCDDCGRYIYIPEAEDQGGGYYYCRACYEDQEEEVK